MEPRSFFRIRAALFCALLLIPVTVPGNGQSTATMETGTLFGGSGDQGLWMMNAGANGDVYLFGSNQGPAGVGVFEPDLPALPPLRNRLIDVAGGVDFYLSRVAGDLRSVKSSELMRLPYRLDARTPMRMAVGPSGEWVFAMGVVGTFRGTAVTQGPYGNAGTSLAEETNQQIYVVKGTADGRSVAFRTRIACDGSLNLGGLGVDAQGNLFVAGDTTCSALLGEAPGLRNAQATGRRIFAVKLRADGGQVLGAALFGGAGADTLANMAVDGAGRPVLLGSTRSADFPVRNDAWDQTLGGSEDGFLARLNGTLSALEICTYLGGSAADRGRALKVDSQNGIVVDLWTESGDIAVTPGALQANAAANQEHTAILRFREGQAAPAWATYADFGYNSYSWVELDAQERVVSIRQQSTPGKWTSDWAMFPEASPERSYLMSVLEEGGVAVRHATRLPGGGMHSGLLSARLPDGRLAIGVAVRGWPPPLSDGQFLMEMPRFSYFDGYDVWLATLRWDQPVLCSVALGETEVSIDPRGESRAVAVIAAAGCPWMVDEGEPALAASVRKSSGIGGGLLQLQFADLAKRAMKTDASLLVGSERLQIRQPLPGCEEMWLDHATVHFLSMAGWGIVQLYGPPDCAAPVEAAPWLSITKVKAGSDVLTPSEYRIAAETNDFGERSSVVRIGSASLVATQDAGACTATLTPANGQVPAAGGELSIALQASAEHCHWKAYAAAPLVVVQGAEGTGNGTIVVRAPATDRADGRTLVLDVAGRSASITQAGGVCAVSPAPSSWLVPANGGSMEREFTVSGAACGWYPVISDSWIRVERSTPVNGRFAMRVSALPNHSGVSRQGFVRVFGRQSSVTQPALPATLLLSTVPAGIPVRVNGSSMIQSGAEPRAIVVTPRSNVSLAAPVFPAAVGQEMRWRRWATGMPATHTVVAPGPGESMVVHATYDSYFRVLARSSNTAQGSVARTPASNDGYYASGSTVRLTATPAAGFRFAGWSGGGGNTPSEAQWEISVGAAMDVVANFAAALPVLQASNVGAMAWEKGKAAATQQVNLTAGSGNVPLNEPVVTCPGGAALLRASLSASATPATLTIAVNVPAASKATPGSFACSVVIERSDGMTPAQLSLSIPLEITAPSVQTRIDSVVEAASYRQMDLAPGSLVSLFGEDLAGATAVAESTPLPTALDGVRVRVRSGTMERDAALVYVSAKQINLVLPDFFPAGEATISVLREGNVMASASIRIAAIAPALFTANATGQGYAAGNHILVSQGTQNWSPLAQCASGICVPQAVATPAAGEESFLVLYGTGFRGLRVVLPEVRIGEMPAEVLYCGPQGSFAGLDQLNIRVPGGLTGKGDLPVTVRHGDTTTNTVLVRF